MLEGLSVSKLEILIGLAVNGIFTGLGVSIGAYLADKHLIKRAERTYRKAERTYKNIKTRLK